MLETNGYRKTLPLGTVNRFHKHPGMTCSFITRSKETKRQTACPRDQRSIIPALGIK
jgi:hypothetical protein